MENGVNGTLALAKALLFDCEPQQQQRKQADANDRDCRLLLDVLCQCQKGRDVGPGHHLAPFKAE